MMMKWSYLGCAPRNFFFAIFCQNSKINLIFMHLKSSCGKKYSLKMITWWKNDIFCHWLQELQLNRISIKLDRIWVDPSLALDFFSHFGVEKILKWRRKKVEWLGRVTNGDKNGDKSFFFVFCHQTVYFSPKNRPFFKKIAPQTNEKKQAQVQNDIFVRSAGSLNQ